MYSIVISFHLYYLYCKSPQIPGSLTWQLWQWMRLTCLRLMKVGFPPAPYALIPFLPVSVHWNNTQKNITRSRMRNMFLSTNERSRKSCHVTCGLVSGSDTCVQGRDCQHICVTTDDSYICKCQMGYVLNRDQKTCSRKKLNLFHILSIFWDFSDCEQKAQDHIISLTSY